MMTDARTKEAIRYLGYGRHAVDEQTLALIDALLRIRHELQYRLTPLPEIFAALGGSRNREIAEFFSRLAALLSSAQTCTVGYACRQALAQTRGLSLSSAARGIRWGDMTSRGAYRRSIWRCPACGRR